MSSSSTGSTIFNDLHCVGCAESHSLLTEFERFEAADPIEPVRRLKVGINGRTPLLGPIIATRTRECTKRRGKSYGRLLCSFFVVCIQVPGHLSVRGRGLELSEIRLLRPDAKIWLVYAGYNRRFLDAFATNNRVFLSLPGFDASPVAFENETEMRRHLAMSDAVARYIRGHTANAPSRNVAGYSPTPYVGNTPEARRFGAELGNIDRLFRQMKIGDIVMSPAANQYDPFLIGEVRTRWSKADDLAIDKLEGEIVPTRRVRWLNVALTKRDFAPRTAKRLVNRHAITLIDERLYDDILDRVYPNYSWGDRSKLDLFGNAYASKDPLQPYEAAKLLKYVMASVFAFRAGQMDNFQALSVDAGIAAYYDEALVEELAQNFNSPGKFTLIAGGGLISILVAAGLIAATADPNGNFDNQRAQISQQMGDSMKGAGKPDVQDEVDNFLNSLEGTTWKPVQQTLGRSAQATMGLSLDNSVEVAQHRAELNAT